jgi:hypothetical protein
MHQHARQLRVDDGHHCAIRLNSRCLRRAFLCDGVDEHRCALVRDLLTSGGWGGGLEDVLNRHLAHFHKQLPHHGKGNRQIIIAPRPRHLL